MSNPTTESLPILWKRLEALLHNPNWNGDEVDGVMRELADASGRAAKDELSATVTEMAKAVRAAPFQEAGIIALCAGTIIEYGGEPDSMYGALTSRLPDVMACAGRLVKAVEAAFPEPTEETPEPTGDVFWVGSIPVPYEWIRNQAQTDSSAVGAFNTLQQWCLPLISIATRHRHLLAQLVKLNDLRNAVAPLAQVSGPAHFLLTLSLVPLQEPLIFIAAISRRGFALTMDCVPDNFTLHTLLAAALAGPLGHKPPPTDVVHCVTGKGPGSCKTTSVGAWNLYTWKAAAQPLNELDNAPHKDWIWHEGRPADIAPFDGTRIVLGGANKIQRSWNTQRIFGSLGASVKLVREMKIAEVTDLLERMARGNATS